MRFVWRRVLFGLIFGFTLVGLARSVDLRGAVLAAEGEGESQGADHALLMKTVNFILLAGALGFLLRKPLGQFLAGRSTSIRKGLEEGRQALEASQAQLRAVEEKLQRVGEEIEAFKAAAAREMEADRQRLRDAAAEEASQVLEAARTQIATSTRAAQLELKMYTARQVVALASEAVRQRLDPAGHGRLVSEFAAKLGSDGKPGGESKVES